MRVAAAAAVIALAGSAHAEDADRGSEAPKRSKFGERPVTLFHASIGMLGLPLAHFCPSPTEQCQPGETSLAVGLMALVRLGNFAVGAGADVAFGLRTEHTTQQGRDHGRGYFSFDGLFRYYLPPLKRLDWWVGASIGAVVVSDSWSTPVDRVPHSDTRFVGPERLTLRSEGFTIGPNIGAHWRFSTRWLVGTHLRYTNWIFPSNRASTPLGDNASLAGRVDAIELGVLLGFRIGL